MENETYVRELAERAFHLKEKARYSEAIDLYKLLLQFVPNEKIYQMELGDTFLQQGTNIDAAVNWITLAISGNADMQHRAYGHSLLAECCAALNNPKGMMSHIFAAIDLDPADTPDYHAKLGDLWRKMGHTEDAIDQYHTARTHYIEKGRRSMVNDEEIPAIHQYAKALVLTSKINELMDNASSVIPVRLLRNTFTNAVMWNCQRLATACAEVLGRCVSSDTADTPMKWQLKPD